MNPYLESTIFYSTLGFTFILSIVMANLASGWSKLSNEHDLAEKEERTHQLKGLKKKRDTAAWVCVFYLVFGWLLSYNLINLIVYNYLKG